MAITTILYDRVTPFNDVDVATINEAWGDRDYVLVYKDGEFTGMAQPLGNKTLEEWQAHFEAEFAAQDTAASEEISQLDRIEAGVSYVQMMI